MKDLTVLPTILENELDKEILTCEAIGQTARARRLRLLVYARLCATNGLQFLARKSDRDRSYLVDSPDVDLDEAPSRDSRLCSMGNWLEAMPSTVVDGVLSIKDKIDMGALYIEYRGADPALLYYLGKVRGHKYYVKLAQWD